MNTTYRRRYGPAGRLLGLLVLGLVVRAVSLHEESAYFDEAVSLVHLDHDTWWGYIRATRQEDPPMTPAYFSLLWGWAQVFGSSIVAARALSVTLWAAFAIVLYALGRRLYGETTALVTVAVSALAVSHVYYAQEIRVYMLVMLLGVASLYTLQRSLDGGGRAWWAAHVALNSLLLFTHWFTALLLAAEGLFLLAWQMRRGWRWRPIWWGVAHLPAVALLGAWMATVDFARLEVLAVWRHEIDYGAQRVLHDLLMLSGITQLTLQPPRILGSLSLEGPGWRLVIGLATLHVLATLWPRRTAVRTTERWDHLNTLLLLGWCAVLPVALLHAASSTFFSAHASRYLLFASAPLLLLVGAGATQWRWRPLAAVLRVLLVGFFALNLALRPGPWRYDYRQAAAIITREAAPDAPLVFFAYGQFHTLALNTDLDPARVVTVRDREAAIATLDQHLANRDAAWLMGVVERAEQQDLPGLVAAYEAAGVDVRTWHCFTIQPQIWVVHLARAGT